MNAKLFTQIVLIGEAFIIPAIVNAQEAVVDTIAVQELNEVVVQAPKVIRKVDMDVYYPSQSAVENSRNGMQLLTNMMVP